MTQEELLAMDYIEFMKFSKGEIFTPSEDVLKRRSSYSKTILEKTVPLLDSEGTKPSIIDDSFKTPTIDPYIDIYEFVRYFRNNVTLPFDNEILGYELQYALYLLGERIKAYAVSSGETVPIGDNFRFRQVDENRLRLERYEEGAWVKWQDYT